MLKKNFNFSYTSFFKSNILIPKNILELKSYLKNKHTIIGNQRSYGDSFIGKKTHISLKNFNKILKIDYKKKIVEVESGTLLLQLNEKTLRKNLILNCAPGCKYVSVGGMIANNISGKLLQKNSLKNFIHSIKIINNKLKLVECSKYKNQKLFYLTINGKGKTGPIISAKLKLEKINSDKFFRKSFHFSNYNDFFKHFKKLNSYKYAVCWIDFTKKNFSGIIFAGSNFKKKNIILKKYNDIKLPNLVISFLSLFVTRKVFTIFFNSIFKLKNLLFKDQVLNLNDFFFPQNKILNWNDLFKKKGFIQFHIFIDRKNMIKIIDSLKSNFDKEKIFSNFAIIKFHNDKIKNYQNMSLSLDIPVHDNYDKIKKILNYHIKKFDIDVNLSKDIILNNLNKKTLNSNPIFNAKMKKFFMKSYISNLFDRLDS